MMEMNAITPDGESEPVVSTGELCRRLGIGLSVERIKSLPVPVAPALEGGPGTYWRERDVVVIALSVAADLMQRAVDMTTADAASAAIHKAKG